MHQQSPFAPLYVRKRRPPADGVADPDGVAAPPEGQG
jgi:hypothetical protein